MSAGIVVNAARGEGASFLYWSEQTGRRARVTWRDATDCPRPQSVGIVLSSPSGREPGREIGGEMSPYTAIRLACAWVGGWDR